MAKCKYCKFVNGAPMCDILGVDDQMCGCGKKGTIIINNNTACFDYVDKIINVGLTINELNNLNDILFSYKEGNYDWLTQEENKDIEKLYDKLSEIFEKD